MNSFLSHHRPDSLAIIDADSGEETSYGELQERVASAAAELGRELDGGLVFLVTGNTPDSIVTYLACLEAERPVCLLEPGLGERLAPLLDAHEPDALLVPAGTELDAGAREPRARLGMYDLHIRQRVAPQGSLHPELALLLTTSGSTGSPKVVRLTRGNLIANARSIAEYLDIGPGERSIQSLPMQYSYGLSLVNSHLVAGGTVVLTGHSFMRPEFWKAFDACGCTSFAGVPYVYETLHRIRFDPGRHPSLKTMTQAGGGLRHDLVESFQQRTSSAGCRFFVMYGQTEATARISYVPPERLAEKIGSIGVPIPGGTMTLEPIDQSDDCELVYEGPNVMMGYAESRAALAAGDELGGRLHTGDLARVDDDGFYSLTGRLTRFAKLYGKRVSLEDVEKHVEREHALEAAALERDGGLQVFLGTASEFDGRELSRKLAKHLGVPLQAVRVSILAEIPRTASGKKDYKAL